MFTPHHPSRPEDQQPGTGSQIPSASRFPSGSLLFPSSGMGTAGRSPMLASSPNTHVPFTMQTPGASLGLGESVMGAKTPFSAFATPALPHPTTSRRPFGGGVATALRTAGGFGAPTPQMASGAVDDERPPLHSLLDAGMPKAAAPAPAATPAAKAADAAADAADAGRADSASANAAATPLPMARAPMGEGLWATAFGYPSSAMLGSVLDELRPSGGGDIVQHCLGEGPWLHVRYADYYQMQQALGKNGKVIHGFMLGVIEGIQPSHGTGLGLGSASGTAGRGGEGLGAPAHGAGLPLRLQQARPGVGPSLRAPPLARAELGKAGWWTRVCEFVFGW